MSQVGGPGADPEPEGPVEQDRAIRARAIVRRTTGLSWSAGAGTGTAMGAGGLAEGTAAAGALRGSAEMPTESMMKM